jgi:caa(3)-type oxidase subunit IV
MKESSLIKIWAVLLGLLFVSIAFGYLENATVGTVLIFGIATVKAYLVGAYYMGLKREPRYIAGLLASGVICMVILFGYLVPDIVYVYGRK